MNEELQQLLINLKLKAIAARCEEYLSAAERDSTPAATLLTQLLAPSGKLVSKPRSPHG